MGGRLFLLRTTLHISILNLLLLLASFPHSSSCHPTDTILLSCGATTTLHLTGNRSFLPDTSPSSSFTISPTSNSTITAGSDLYTSARVFTQTTSYRFRLKKKGKFFLRLHFHPIETSRYSLKNASFSVSANGFWLLSDFSFANMSFLDSAVLKEYVLETSGFSVVVVEFSPSDGSVAFVNAIEVVSVPDHLFPAVAMPVGGGGDAVKLPPSSAMESVYRVNVGGPFLDSANDTLWRIWIPDRKFLLHACAGLTISIDPSMVKYPSGLSAEIAPKCVYATAREMADVGVIDQRFNVSWVFEVIPGFDYVVRLHFCDVVSKTVDELVFDVFINNQSALVGFDLSRKTMGMKTAYYVDFLVNNDGVNSRKIFVQIGPAAVVNGLPNAILNGIEIMKLSVADGSLDVSYSSVDAKKKKINSVELITFLCIGGAAVCCSILAAVLLCRRQQFQETTKRNPETNSDMFLSPHQMGISQTKTSAITIVLHSTSNSSAFHRVLSFPEIWEATRNFDESLVVGVGGFGKVYKGVLRDRQVVAVKRGNPRSRQGHIEFRTEIEMLSKLRHRHLVSLIGYCQEQNEMVLVYEYMAGGSLQRHLYGAPILPKLSWKQRLEICIGAAKGLHYLHSGSTGTVIHRDIKTTNILLDGDLTAKVADFGLSKLGPSLDQTHVSTAVKGSFGYLDPEYFRRQQLTEKSDVYSFGVVLVEVLCARPAVNPALPREQVNIAEWAMHWQKRGQLDHIVDSHIVGSISPDSLRKFGKTAEKCLAEYGLDRPTMGDVLWNLEYALQLQQAFTAVTADDNSSTIGIQDFPDCIPDIKLDEGQNVSSVSADGSESAATTTSDVFSQLMNPKGR